MAKKRKKSKGNGAVSCAVCCERINELECFLLPNGSHIHIECGMGCPRVIIGGRSVGPQRVLTPGSQKKKDNRFSSRECFFGEFF